MRKKTHILLVLGILAVVMYVVAIVTIDYLYSNTYVYQESAQAMCQYIQFSEEKVPTCYRYNVNYDDPAMQLKEIWLSVQRECGHCKN